MSRSGRGWPSCPDRSQWPTRGGAGFGLSRSLTAAGIRCEVLAPSKLQRLSGDRVKTDAKDAVYLAGLLRLDEYTPVAGGPGRASVASASTNASCNGSDGSLFSGASANDEYVTAHTLMGLSPTTLAQIARTSIEASSCPEPLRSCAMAGIGRWAKGPDRVHAEASGE